jgi:glycerol-3-phosphate dehydrogenase
LKREGGSGEAPLLNVFGGKLTTYRRLAEEALEIIGDAVGSRGAPWTAESVLPGGDFGTNGFDSELARLEADYAFLPPTNAARLLRLYGTQARAILGDATGTVDLGDDFGAGLTAREVDYLTDREWARTAEDILWRRTKLGLHLTARDVKALEAYLESLTSGGDE